MRSSSTFVDLTENGHLRSSGIFQAGCWCQRWKVRASHMTQLHFQLCTSRTLPIAFVPKTRCRLSFPKFHGGTLRQQLGSQHLTAFPIQSTSDPAHCPYFPLRFPNPTPVRVCRRSAAARATVWCPSRRRMPGGGRARGSHTSGRTQPPAGVPRPPQPPAGGCTGARQPGPPATPPPSTPPRPRSLPPRPAPRVASPPHRGSPPSACAPRCRACRPHSPHPLRELVTSCPRPISVRGQSVAPCRSRRLLCFPLPTLSTAVARAVQGRGGRERTGLTSIKFPEASATRKAPGGGPAQLPAPLQSPGDRCRWSGAEGSRARRGRCPGERRLSPACSGSSSFGCCARRFLLSTACARAPPARRSGARRAAVSRRRHHRRHRRGPRTW